MDGMDIIGNRVIIKSPYGEFMGTGKIIAYRPEPSVQIEMDNGQIFWWTASHCQIKKNSRRKII